MFKHQRSTWPLLPLHDQMHQPSRTTTLNDISPPFLVLNLKIDVFKQKKDTSEFYLTVSYFLTALFKGPLFLKTMPSQSPISSLFGWKKQSAQKQARPTSEAPSFEEIEILLDEAAMTLGPRVVPRRKWQAYDGLMALWMGDPKLFNRWVFAGTSKWTYQCTK